MDLLKIFWIFLKVNLLSTSGPSSVGLLYTETVSRSIMTEEQFVEAVGFSSVLPGSDALQLAMFVGYAAGGVPGALVALLGSILPPTVLMLTIAIFLRHLQREPWVANFVRGISPAVAVLLVLTAWQLFGQTKGLRNWAMLGIAVLSLVAFQLQVHPAIVLLAAGLLGIVILR